LVDSRISCTISIEMSWVVTSAQLN
jgi:hypothetical protein